MARPSSSAAKRTAGEPTPAPAAPAAPAAAAAKAAATPAVEVTVRVPEARVGEFHSWFGAWLQSDPASPGPPPALPPTPLQPWDKTQDGELARTVWRSLRHPTPELLLLLLDRSGQPVHYKDLGAPVGLTTGFAVGNALTWAARAFVAAGKAFPVHTHDAGDGPMYWFDPELIGLFRAAAKPLDPPDQAERTTETDARPE
jgi:hypothetical protein